MRGPRGQHRHDEFFRGGPPWAGAGGGWGGGGRRMRRGDTRQVVLRTLLDGPAHGYEIIRRLEERSAGLWRPSAGSIYPTLQLLEEQGLVTSRDDGGKRVYELTAEGRAQVEAQGPGDMPWETPGRPGGPACAARHGRPVAAGGPAGGHGGQRHPDRASHRDSQGSSPEAVPTAGRGLTHRRPAPGIRPGTGPGRSRSESYHYRGA